MRGNVTVLAAAIAGLALLPTLQAVQPSYAAESARMSMTQRLTADRVVDLGEPVHKTQSLSSAIGKGPEGEPQAYFFVEGNPTTTGEFAVVDLRSKQTVLDVRIPSGNGSSRTMSVSPVDGAVYFVAENTADLYRYRPGTDQVEQLAKLSPDQRVWELAIGIDGTVWAGTYPGGKLISYDPATEQIEDFGQALPGEQYIEAIEQVGDEIVVGTQPNGKLAAFQSSGETFTEIALPAGHQSDSVDELNLRGSLLFVTTEGKALIRDTVSDSWIGELPSLSGRGVSPIDPATGNTVYFRTAAGSAARYNLETRQVETLNWRPNGSPEAWEWVDLGDPNLPGLSVAFTFYTDGRVYGYNPRLRVRITTRRR